MSDLPSVYEPLSEADARTHSLLDTPTPVRFDREYPYVAPPGSAHTLHELDYLISLIPLRKEWGAFIRAADENMEGLFVRLCGELGVPCDESDLRRRTREAAIPITKLKWRYNRPRPYQVAAKHGRLAGQGSVWKEGDFSVLDSVSAHTPAYPSGHTIQANLLASHLSELAPQHRKAFMGLADRISTSRVVAGYHWPSDVSFGEDVFRHMVLPDMPSSIRVAARKTSRREILDKALVQRFRKDLLALAKAAESVRTLQDVQEVASAVNRWGEQFESFTATVRKDLERRRSRATQDYHPEYNANPPSLDQVEYWLDRGGLEDMWRFASEVRRIPSGRIELKNRGGGRWKPPEQVREDLIQFWIDRGDTVGEAEIKVDDYLRSRPSWTREEAEANVVAKWKEEARKWARRVRDRARPAWSRLESLAEWMEDWRGGRQSLEFITPEEEVVNLSGFRVVFRGFAESPYQDELPAVQEGLARFRRAAQARAPIILKRIVPIHVEWTFEPSTRGNAAAYYERGMIYITPWVIGKDMGRFVWVLAHEMGHHLYQTVLSGQATKEWDSFILGTYTDLDLRDVLRRMEALGATSLVFDEALHEDPILYLQLAGLEQGRRELRDLMSADDVREYLDAGGDPNVRVMAMPISGYAHKNPQEAFCEALGKLVAYGPKAVPDVVLGMLRRVLPTVRISSDKTTPHQFVDGRVARGKAKKDVGHGGLDEWFSGHGGAKGEGEDATWGDWVSISPVTRTLPSGKKVEKGDIVGECGISDDPDWKEITKGGEDPLKCMPRSKAYDMGRKERAEKAKAKQKAEKADSSRGKKPTMTPTFDKPKKKASGIDRVFRSPKPFTGFRPVSGQGHDFKPKGLWYSCGSEWDDWCRYEMPQWITGSPYVYRIEVNLSRMIVIRNAEDFKDFESKYGVLQRGMMRIDWKEVARDYDGIEICPYQHRFRMSSDWYYPWDVASGCIWGSGAFKSVEPLESCGITERVANRKLADDRHGAQIALMRFLSDVARRQRVGDHVYVVGGAVRNFVLDRPIKDIDVVIDAVALGERFRKPHDSEWFAKTLQRNIPAQTNLTTNQYGVAILTVKGDWMVDGHNLKDEVIEIANARKESYGGEAGKGYKPDQVVPATIEEDILRREFTFNTLLWRLQDVATGPENAEIVDLTGCGLRDLNNMTMRCPRDPDVVFADDPTRMLRAIKFATKYGFKIPDDVAASIRKNAGKMKQAPWEAIASIFINNVLNEPTAPKALRQMKSLGLLDVVAEMVQEQKPFATYLSKQLRNRNVALLLDLLDLGITNPSPLSFLTRDQQLRLREITVPMGNGEADAFAAYLAKPQVDNGSLIRDFDLQGSSRSLPVEYAREALLENPDLMGNQAALDAAIRDLFRAKGTSRQASLSDLWGHTLFGDRVAARNQNPYATDFGGSWTIKFDVGRMEPLLWTPSGFKDSRKLDYTRSSRRPKDFRTQAEANREIQTEVLDFIRDYRSDQADLIRGWDRTLLGAEAIPGGKARGMKPTDFDSDELDAGIEVEHEHLVGGGYSKEDARAKAREIAMDHLAEIPDYYTRLDAMESAAGVKHAGLSAAWGKTLEENEYLLQQALTPVPGQKQASKKASTNTERYYYKATDGKWYVENEEYEEDWETGAQIEGEMTHYGPFPSFDAAYEHMRRNFANSGSFSKDDSGRQRPPRNPVTPGRSRRFWGSSFKRPDGFYLERHAPMSRDDFGNYEYVNKFDPDANYWRPMDKQELNRILAYWKRTKADWAWRWEEVRNGRVVKKDSGKGTQFERSYDGPGIYDSDSDSYFRRRRSAVAPAAPTAEGDFYKDPRKSEVREFAETKAISNDPKIVEQAAPELDVPESKAIQEAEAAPPTPVEIAKEPGGGAVSTLNRYVIETEDPAAEPAAIENQVERVGEAGVKEASMSPLDLERFATRIERLQRIRTHGWNPADGLEFKNMLPGGRGHRRLPDPKKLREIARDAPFSDEDSRFVSSNWRNWMTWAMQAEGLVRDNDPRNPRRMMRDMARGRFPGRGR